MEKDKRMIEKRAKCWDHVRQAFKCHESPSAVCVSSVQRCASDFPNPKGGEEELIHN